MVRPAAGRRHSQVTPCLFAGCQEQSVNGIIISRQERFKQQRDEPSEGEDANIKGLIFRFPPENPTAASVCFHLLSERKTWIIIRFMKASKYFIPDELRMQGWWKWQLLEQTTDVPDKERLPSFLQQCSRHALQSPQEIIPKRLAFTCSGHTFYSLFFDELVRVGPVWLITNHSVPAPEPYAPVSASEMCIWRCGLYSSLLTRQNISVPKCDQSFHLQLCFTFYQDLLRTLNRTGRCLWKGCELILTEYWTQVWVQYFRECCISRFLVSV